MNTSVNYSGFVDLLQNSALESTHQAESKEDEGLELVLQHKSKQLSSIYRTLTEIAGKEK